MDNVTIKIGADASTVRPAIDDSRQALGELGGKVVDTKQGMADLAAQVAEASKELINGANPLTVFAQHSHDVFSAISEVTKITKGFIGFMGGPWGIAINAAIGVVGTLIDKYYGAADASKGLRQEQGQLASYLDRTTGKVKEQIGQIALLVHARNLEQQEKDAERKYREQRISVNETIRGAFQPIIVSDPVIGTQIVDTPLSENKNIQRKVLGYLQQYNNRKINIATLNGDISSLAEKAPALKSLAGSFLDVANGTQKAAENLLGVRVDIGRAAKALGTVTPQQEKLISAYTEKNGDGSGGTLLDSNQLRANSSRSTTSRAALSVTVPTVNIKTSILQIDASTARVISPAATTTDPANDLASGKEVNNIIGAADKPLPLSKPLDNLLQSATKTYTAIGKEGDKVATEQQKSWKEMASSIAGAFGSSLQGMIKGTQNFRGMMLNIGNAILGEATKWIQKRVSIFLTGELTQTAATTAGVTARTGIEATGAATSAGISATSALTQIGHSAAVAAAGAYAAIAKIAYVGPVLAPIAAAVALAGVIALGKSIFSAEGGMGQVPYDGAMFELHKDEMVLPASLATPMRSMLLNPASGHDAPMAANRNSSTDGDVHLHIHAVDTQSGVDFLMRNKHAVAKAVNGAVRNGFKAKG